MDLRILWFEPEPLLVGDELMRRQNWNGERYADDETENQNQRIAASEDVAPCSVSHPAEPADGSAGEVDRIDWRQVVVLGVQGHHQGKKDEVRHTEKAVWPRC